MRLTRRVSRNQRRKDGGPVYDQCMGEPTSQDGAPPLPQPENNGPSGVGQSRMVCHCDDATHCGLGDLLFRGQSGGGEGAHRIQRPELDSAQFQNRVAQYIVEKGYGYSTDVVFGATLPPLQGLRRGDTQVTMEIWLPNQTEAWVAAQESVEVVTIGESLGETGSQPS